MNKLKFPPKIGDEENDRNGFSNWLARYIDKDAKKSDVDEILADPTALQFLIAWTFFEQTYFKGFMKTADFKSFVKKPCIENSLKDLKLNDHCEHFQKRYKGTDGKKRIANLFHEKNGDENKSGDFEKLLDKHTKDADLELFEKANFSCFCLVSAA